MNRINRVTSILIQLQSKKIIPAKEIAQRFNISLRTVYRDIRTLEEAGIPIGSEAGKGYFLVEGFLLPPVMFTAAEVGALITAGKFLNCHGDESFIKDFDSAMYKIKSILKHGEKNYAQELENSINVYSTSGQKNTLADNVIGFRVLKLDDTNMKDVYYAPDDYDQGMLAGLESNIKEDRTDLDLLFGCLIDWGLPLSLPYKSEKIDGCTVHTYNDGDLIACFDANVPESVVKEIAKRKPLRAVFRDSSFADSPSKINVFEIFKLYMPEDANDISKRVRVI